MKKVKCKKCDNFHEYTPLEGKTKKYLSKLEQQPTEDCHTSIYLECDNNHLDKYFCKIEHNSTKRFAALRYVLNYIKSFLLLDFQFL